MQKIVPCLWFDSNAEEAVDFYDSVFKKSKIGIITRYDAGSAAVSGQPKGSVLTVSFKLMGQDFLALNGGPVFKFSPAISFFVYCKTKPAIDYLFKKLSQNGEILMPLDKYPFSERYAFLKDKFGVAWQLILSPSQPHITPCLLFVGKDLGKAESAIKFYTAQFKYAHIDHILYYGKGETGKAGSIKHASFFLEGQEFVAMDGSGPHKFGFNESISFVINCDTQDEIDTYWQKLTKGGEQSQCGWLKDKFGVSWQIVPIELDGMLNDKDAKKSERVMTELLKMHKLDIKKLKQAYEK
ncbi:MAG: VOC family protein [Nanoarchaeota archaeon]